MTILSSSVSFDEIPPEVEIPPQSHLFEECQSPVKFRKGSTVKQNLHIKCLALSALTGTCLTAMFWCSFTSVSRLLVNLNAFSLSRQPITSQCDPTYVYIPIVFMIAFYLLYLFECFQCDTRYMLTHHMNESQIQSQINRLRNSQPIIWWKALNYHYLRRTRLITRYRNGEAFTSTQVYFQRVNSRITSTCYVYDQGNDLNRPNCVDISRKIVDLDKFGLVKIKLSKGFAFSNVAEATEFERQRNAFFSANENIDDFLEMREGLDLINCSFPDYLLCKSDNAPWYISQSAFWCFSLLLLSWPVRLAIQMHLAHLNYQIVKLFGANSSLSTFSDAPSLTLPDSNSTAIDTIVTQPDDRSSNFTSTLATISCSLPPSYSEAMLWPPTYSSIASHLTSNNLIEPTTRLTSNSARSIRMQKSNTLHAIAEHGLELESSSNDSWTSCWNLIGKSNHFVAVESQCESNSKLPLRSSVSCSMQLGQLVFVVDPLETIVQSNGRPNRTQFDCKPEVSNSTLEQLQVIASNLKQSLSRLSLGSIRKSYTDDQLSSRSRLRSFNAMKSNWKASFQSLHNLKSSSNESLI